MEAEEITKILEDTALASKEWTLHKYAKPQDGLEHYRLTIYNPIKEFDGVTVEDAVKQMVEYLDSLEKKEESEEK